MSGLLKDVLSFRKVGELNEMVVSRFMRTVNKVTKTPETHDCFHRNHYQKSLFLLLSSNISRNVLLRCSQPEVDGIVDKVGIMKSSAKLLPIFIFVFKFKSGVIVIQCNGWSDVCEPTHFFFIVILTLEHMMLHL